MPGSSASGFGCIGFDRTDVTLLIEGGRGGALLRATLYEFQESCKAARATPPTKGFIQVVRTQGVIGGGF